MSENKWFTLVEDEIKTLIRNMGLASTTFEYQMDLVRKGIFPVDRLARDIKDALIGFQVSLYSHANLLKVSNCAPQEQRENELKEIVNNICGIGRAFNYVTTNNGLNNKELDFVIIDLQLDICKVYKRLEALTSSIKQPEQVQDKLPNLASRVAILQRLHDIGQAVECARGAMTGELDALASDISTLSNYVTNAKSCADSTAGGVTCVYNVEIGVNGGDADEIKSAVTDATMQAVEQLDSELRTAAPFKLLSTGTIHVNDAPITDGTLTGSADACHSPFKFALGEAVELVLTCERGKVTSRANHLNATNSYLVVYHASGGRGRQEAWLDESEIVSLPVDPEQ